MGCGSSSEGTNNGVNEPYNRRPKISVRIQPNVKTLDNQPLIAFIFGGPGSRKGRIIDDLVTSYGFNFISGEDLIIENLPKSLGCESNAELRTMLTHEGLEKLSLQWLLDVISDKISQGSSNDRYIIDILPTLKLLLRIKSMVNDCHAALQQFEERHPIAFALNLAIPVDRVLKTKQIYCAEPGKADKLSKDGQSDEADSSRTKYRASAYSQHVQTYLDYFTDSQRLVTVDVSSGNADTIWQRVHELLSFELRIVPHRTVNTVIIFSFEDNDIKEVDCNKYSVECLRLSEVVNNPNDSPENLLRALSDHIDKRSQENESFAVMCEGTTLGTQANKKPSKKLLVFAGSEPHPVQEYLPGNPHNNNHKSRSQQNIYNYKAVSSLENEICLFPFNTQDNTCTSIATFMAKEREIAR